MNRISFNPVVHMTITMLMIMVCTPSPIEAQNGYRPGQTYSNRQLQATPHPTATPPVQYRQPQQQPMYNLEPTPAVIRRTPRASAPKTESRRVTQQTPKRTPVPKKATSEGASPATTPAPAPEPEEPVTASTPQLTPAPSPVVETPEAPLPEPAPPSPTAAQNGHVQDTTAPPPKDITNWPTGKKLISLTYDDGPNPAFTPKLLDYLKDANVKATFYVCGNMVKNKPELVARIVNEGHEIANHSYSHKVLTKLSKEKLYEELEETNTAIRVAAPGARISTMRAPYGATNSTVQRAAQELGMRIIMWDVDTLDWKGRSAEQITNTIMKGTGDGSIILMHDRLHRNKDSVMVATRSVVEQLRAKGYEFVTVHDLISHPKATRTSSIRTSSENDLSTSTVGN